MFDLRFSRLRSVTPPLQDFKMRISEKGANFEQEVDLDEEEHVVTVHVPAHNDLDDTYFMTDFEKVLLFQFIILKQIAEV